MSKYDDFDGATESVVEEVVSFDGFGYNGRHGKWMVGQGDDRTVQRPSTRSEPTTDRDASGHSVCSNQIDSYPCRLVFAALAAGQQAQQCGPLRD